MAVIIGQATTVSFESACITSANWSLQPNSQRVYCLGSWSASYIIYKPVMNLNLTMYAPGPGPFDVSYSTSCADVGKYTATVSPAGCVPPDENSAILNSFTYSYYISSYSFSKDDAAMPGQESFSLTYWMNESELAALGSTFAGSGADVITQEPTTVIRNVSEGTRSERLGSRTGIDFDSSQPIIRGLSGSVSAAQVGNAEITETGVVTFVGNSDAIAGDTGNGSASIQLVPLYF